MSNKYIHESKKSLIKQFFLLSLIALIGSIFCLNDLSDARGSSGSLSNSRGGSGTRSVNWSGNQRSANGTYTGKQVRTWNGSSSGTYDKSSRTYSGSKTVTGPQGNSKTYQIERMGNGFGGATTTVTRKNGNSRIFNTQRSVDKENNTVNRSVTGSQGNTKNYSTQYKNNGDDSYSYTTTGPNGGKDSGIYTINP